MVPENKKLPMIACLGSDHSIKSCSHNWQMPGAHHVSFEVQLSQIHQQLVLFVISRSRKCHIITSWMSKVDVKFTDKNVKVFRNKRFSKFCTG